MSIISRQRCPRDTKRHPGARRSRAIGSMDPISRNAPSRVTKTMVLRNVLIGLLLLSFAACGDFHGPWEYYPEEREVYTGIYTYGYVMADEEPEICFSKVYELDESSAENFAFYDSARVTVQGKFSKVSGETDAVVELSPYDEKPNCFHSAEYRGIVGQSYSMEAYFVWDSSGHKAKSTYKAVATVPSPVKIKGLSVPQQNGSYKWMPYDEKNPKFSIKFLEFPMDMEFVKCALDYDKSVRGVLAVLNYDMENSESQNTTLNNMFKGMMKADSTGYRGIALHDPLEKSQNLGFTAYQKVGSYNALDTAYLTNMMLPLGEVTVDLYSTDAAYIDYIDKVKGSVEDSRVVPESNIENGMGVFSGMSKAVVSLYVKGDGVDMEHIAWSNCDKKEGDNSDSWDSRGCRLYQDVACAGIPVKSIDARGLLEENKNAYTYYEYSSYEKTSETCYASHVKAAMMLDTVSWSVFLPDTINAEAKSEAYADGLKRYCVASNFKSNKIADCAKLKKECLESSERNNCKEYLWNWCADRGWDIGENGYEQCRSALVSRYHLEEVKSSIIQREVREICDYYKPSICKNW